MFVRGGAVDPGDSLTGAGSGGNYWSSDKDYSDAYFLYFYLSYVITPSYYKDRYYGFSVRCVALGG